MKENILVKEFDNIMESVCEALLITDGKGTIVKIGRDFGETYEIAPEEMIGKSIYEMEQKGYLNPSISRMVIESKERTTIKQKIKKGRDVIVTGIPILDAGGELKFVVSFCRDITDFVALQNQYKSLEGEMNRYREELRILRNEHVEVEGVVAESPQMIRILQMIKKIALFDATVLLTGGSGVGKSMLAKLIHNMSGRKDGPYIEINCGAIPENLLESELFGYEKGSFTGANREGKVGLIELAQNGTLFLDEISELPLNLQVKVLKVIQDKKIMRVGSTKEIYVDFRLITASNKDMEEQVRKGLFREDLYYRLKVIPMEIPPLKDRKEDIIPMSMFFIDKFNEAYGLEKSLSYEVIEIFQKYEWPGNIRELENLIERLVLTSETDSIDIESLPVEMKNMGHGYSDGSAGGRTLSEALEELERKMVCDAYAQCGTTIGVAKLLGVSQPTAVRKIKKYL